MKRLTAYLGMVDRNNNHVRPRVRRIILDDTARTFGGYTAANAEGGYQDSHGYVHVEPSVRIEVVTDASDATVRAWVERLRILANQESVLLTSHDIDADFIGLTTERKAA